MDLRPGLRREHAALVIDDAPFGGVGHPASPERVNGHERVSEVARPHGIAHEGAPDRGRRALQALPLHVEDASPPTPGQSMRSRSPSRRITPAPLSWAITRKVCMFRVAPRYAPRVRLSSSRVRSRTMSARSRSVSLPSAAAAAAMAAGRSGARAPGIEPSSITMPSASRGCSRKSMIPVMQGPTSRPFGSSGPIPRRALPRRSCRRTRARLRCP